MKSPARQALKDLLKADWVFLSLPLKWPVQTPQLLLFRKFCTRAMWGGNEVPQKSPDSSAAVCFTGISNPCRKHFGKVPAIFIHNHILTRALDLCHLPRGQKSAEKSLESFSSVCGRYDFGSFRFSARRLLTIVFVHGTSRPEPNLWTCRGAGPGDSMWAGSCDPGSVGTEQHIIENWCVLGFKSPLWGAVMDLSGNWAGELCCPWHVGNIGGLLY